MIQRPVTAAECGRGEYGAVDVVETVRDRGFEIEAQR